MLAKFLETIVNMLKDSSVDHMITGSVASTYYSEPRMTRDVDIVVDMGLENSKMLEELAKSENFYIDDLSSAVEKQDMCNILNPETGWKADLIILKDRPFSQKEFSRRTKTTLLGVETYITSLEDIILAKLEWAHKSKSEIQINDITNLFRMRHQDIDFEYLKTWAYELQLVDDLERVINSLD